MNRRQFLKKGLEGIIIGSILFISCSKYPTKSEIKELNIVDFTMEQNITYLLTSENNVYEMSSSDEATLIKINNRKTYYKLKLKEFLTDNIGVNRYVILCKGDSMCYGIISPGLTDSTISYSSRFVRINPYTGDEEFLNYIEGYPAGLFISGDKMWYISNRITLSSILRSYDKYSGKMLEKIITPIYDARGLSIDEDGNFTTYEKSSNSFIKFKIENNEFKLEN